jgi:hypothetical protein
VRASTTANCPASSSRPTAREAQLRFKWPSSAAHCGCERNHFLAATRRSNSFRIAALPIQRASA